MIYLSASWIDVYPQIWEIFKLCLRTGFRAFSVIFARIWVTGTDSQLCYSNGWFGCWSCCFKLACCFNRTYQRMAQLFLYYYHIKVISRYSMETKIPSLVLSVVSMSTKFWRMSEKFSSTDFSIFPVVRYCLMYRNKVDFPDFWSPTNKKITEKDYKKLIRNTRKRLMP